MLSEKSQIQRTTGCMIKIKALRKLGIKRNIHNATEQHTEPTKVCIWVLLLNPATSLNSQISSSNFSRVCIWNHAHPLAQSLRHI